MRHRWHQSTRYLDSWERKENQLAISTTRPCFQRTHKKIVPRAKSQSKSWFEQLAKTSSASSPISTYHGSSSWREVETWADSNVRIQKNAVDYSQKNSTVLLAMGVSKNHTFPALDIYNRYTARRHVNLHFPHGALARHKERHQFLSCATSTGERHELLRRELIG